MKTIQISEENYEAYFAHPGTFRTADDVIISLVDSAKKYNDVLQIFNNYDHYPEHEKMIMMIRNSYFKGEINNE